MPVLLERGVRVPRPHSNHVVGGEPAHDGPADEDGQPTGQHPVQQHCGHAYGGGGTKGGEAADQCGLTAPAPPGVGAADASVPPTMVTTVTVTNVVPPPKASTLAHNARAAPRVVAAQPKTISPSLPGLTDQIQQFAAHLASFGRTAVPSQRRNFGTMRNVPTALSAMPPAR